MPDPLPAPLHVPERLVPLPPVDWDALSATKRAKLKAKYRLKVKDLKLIDQAVVSSSLSQMGALLVAVCGFPDADTACSAKITNRDKVKHLLDGVNFTLQLLDHLDAMYENSIFSTVLNNALFRSADAIGVVHNDLFSPITLPCMALASSAVERVLLSYRTGTHVPKDFSAVEFTPIYFTHLATLAAIYNTPKAQGQLVKHLHRLADQSRPSLLQDTAWKVRVRLIPLQLLIKVPFNLPELRPRCTEP
ncbi:hypothetical protein BN14_12179 [Rhizoctonia solani AG-1 IB]|uniref:DUF6532 domain-containing protein n=1 Tax=Thanatephorus cucumeris (strain AG1-IB / isolate 7/3/14) TaxID=1108050 RepID=M5CHK3_THACB|nr:hypothetical protein BN14_12179 [Rhizoctonia solani AG-1 IB]